MQYENNQKINYCRNQKCH